MLQNTLFLHQFPWRDYYFKKSTQGDCVNITVKFKDAAALDAWCAVEVHDDLVDALDPYRFRNYWEAARTEDESADPATLEWQRIEVKSCH